MGMRQKLHKKIKVRISSGISLSKEHYVLYVHVPACIMWHCYSNPWPSGAATQGPRVLPVLPGTGGGRWQRSSQTWGSWDAPCPGGLGWPLAPTDDPLLKTAPPGMGREGEERGKRRGRGKEGREGWGKRRGRGRRGGARGGEGGRRGERGGVRGGEGGRRGRGRRGKRGGARGGEGGRRGERGGARGGEDKWKIKGAIISTHESQRAKSVGLICNNGTSTL